MAPRRSDLVCVLALGLLWGCSAFSKSTPAPTAASCSTFSVSSASATFAANAGSGSFTVTASPGSCPWSASVNVPAGQSTAVKITSGATGTGAGTVSYDVDSNTAMKLRTNEIVVSLNSGGTPVKHTVTQQAPTAGCALTLASPSAMTFGSAGGAGTVTVNASSPTCGWFIDIQSPADDWMRVSAQGSAVGTGSAIFNVLSSGSTPVAPLPRTGNVVVLDVSSLKVLTLSVTQK
jgi:hypothetical protein